MRNLKKITERELDLYVDRWLQKNSKMIKHQSAMEGLVDEIISEMEQEDLTPGRREKRWVSLSARIVNIGLIFGSLFEFVVYSLPFATLVPIIQCVYAYFLIEDSQYSHVSKWSTFFKWFFFFFGVFAFVLSNVLFVL